MNSKRIHALPLQLANQIAAGEVVERPASVLKELVENSIDAGATQIDITIEGAGRELIKVTDNGGGIHADDLLLALSRHATSKLYSSEQLSQIASLGFRGEALPSIGSVSRLSLISRQANSECGWQIHTDSEQVEPASHPVGTTVAVAELFFNLPARRHFLRSNKTELHHLLTTFNRLALSRFDIGFYAKINDQQSIRLPALVDSEQYGARIGKICGQAFLRDSVYLSQHYDDIVLQGWVGKVSAHRAQTDVQYFFINGRVIRDKVINHAIRIAYGDLLPAGRQPAYVLYLSLPLDRVDVNVHPTKHEVRFRDARLIHGLITKALDEAITVEKIELPKQAPLDLTPPSPPSSDTLIAEQSSNYRANQQIPRTKTQSAPQHHAAGSRLLHQRYLLLIEPEPALVDLQQLEQHYRQQQFISSVQNGQVVSRSVLVPVSLAISDDDSKLLRQYNDLLEQCGFIALQLDSTIAFRRIPYLLSSIALEHMLYCLLTALKATPSLNNMVNFLAQSIPLIPVTSPTQAEKILSQFSKKQLITSELYRILDSATLAGLFSTDNFDKNPLQSG